MEKLYIKKEIQQLIYIVSASARSFGPRIASCIPPPLTASSNSSHVLAKKPNHLELVLPGFVEEAVGSEDGPATCAGDSCRVRLVGLGPSTISISSSSSLGKTGKGATARPLENLCGFKGVVVGVSSSLGRTANGATD